MYENTDRCYVEIEGLMLRAHHGVGEVERIVGNDFRIDIRLRYDASRAMHSDSIVSAINYATVVEIVRHEMAVPSSLLEHVVGRLRRAIVSEMPEVISGRIRLAKIQPPVSAQLTACAFVLEW